MVKWLLDRGYTVFVISWVNPDETHQPLTFEDYMRHGVLDALTAIEQATGEARVNAAGYCIGGTLLGATLAYMAATGDTRIASATFFASQQDFSEAGDLEVFIDEAQLKAVEARMKAKGGYLPADAMAWAFDMLRSNDLIWSYVIQNYLLGKAPLPFDLLYWNSDATRMPATMHLFYLREFYQNNALANGSLVLGGQRLDLGKVTIPVYLQSSRDDHIAPYRSVFKATRLFAGPVRFIVAGSGHIAGVINPPQADKYQYWTSSEAADTIEAWWAEAVEHPGSWWPDWEAWLASLSGDKIPARNPGEGALAPIEDAPGSYVRKSGR
jgi:polyhydroxyalkanoate synthase